MHPMLAGIIAGAVMGAVFDVLVIMGLRSLVKDPPPWLQIVLRQAGFVRFAVVSVALSTHAAWTSAGLMAGILYYLLYDESVATGLFSPFLWYTVAVLAMAAPYYAVTVLYAGRLRSWLLPAPLAFAAAFGWLLPALAA